jgi:hypothetical protein
MKIYLESLCGHYGLDAEHDLHGLTSAEVKRELVKFLHFCEQDGCRCVHIIHGKGYRSENKRGESLFLRKLVLGIPAQASGKNLTRPPMPSEQTQHQHRHLFVRWNKMLALPDVVLTRHLGHFLRPANAENPGNVALAK